MYGAYDGDNDGEDDGTDDDCLFRNLDDLRGRDINYVVTVLLRVSE